MALTIQSGRPDEALPRFSQPLIRVVGRAGINCLGVQQQFFSAAVGINDEFAPG